MFIVQEIQTAADGTVAIVPPYQTANQLEAESNYHMRLGAAAISTVPLHTVAMYDEYGTLIKNEWYEHPVETEE